MGYIRMNRLKTGFVVTDAAATIGEVAQVFEQLPGDVRSGTYVVVRLAGGGFAALTQADLAQTIENADADAARTTRLGDVPDLLVASLTVERMAQGVGEARDVMYDSYKSRLIVLQDGEPVGLLTSEDQEGGFGGALSAVVGPGQRSENVSEGRFTVRCPEDGGVYDLFQVLDAATGQLRCPNGHEIMR
jgi:hypothetical protein